MAGRGDGGLDSLSGAALLLPGGEAEFATEGGGRGKGGRGRWCTRTCMVGAAGNFSIQYNIAVLSVAVAFMTAVDGKAADDDTGSAYPEPAWAKNSLLGTVFAGILTGLLTMGYVADAVGRRAGLLITNTLVVVGALATALASWGSASSVYTVVAVARFVVGFGVGGIYPTAFATVAEGEHGSGGHSGVRDEEARRAASKAVGGAYLWQMPGAMAPYAVAWALLALPASTVALVSTQFRVLVAIGVVPVALVLWEAWHTPPPPASAAPRQNPLAVVRATPQYLRRLIGTAGAWMLYDAGYYGTAIEIPNILTLIFGSGNTLADTCWQSLVVAGFGIPGTLLALWPLRKYGARWLNIWGFVVLAAAFAALAIAYYASPEGAKGVKFTLLCFISLALSWGPSVGVHVLATMLYPPEVRGTFISLSSMGGKLGGLIGTFIFEPIQSAAGLPAVLWVQVAFSIIGCILSITCLPSDAPGVPLQVDLGRDEDADRDAALLLAPGTPGGREWATTDSETASINSMHL